MTTSGYRTSRDKVIQGETVKRTEHTPRTLHSLVNHFGRRVDPVWIVVGGPGILDVVPHLELLEALCMSIVNILGIGDELRRIRRSIGSRHFKRRTG